MNRMGVCCLLLGIYLVTVLVRLRCDNITMMLHIPSNIMHQPNFYPTIVLTSNVLKLKPTFSPCQADARAEATWPFLATMRFCCGIRKKTNNSCYLECSSPLSTITKLSNIMICWQPLFCSVHYGFSCL